MLWNYTNTHTHPRKHLVLYNSREILGTRKRKVWETGHRVLYRHLNILWTTKRNSLCKQSPAPIMPCGVCMSRPSSDGEEEVVADDGEEEEEQCWGEVGRHWEPWLGMADWELWDGIWADVELEVLCMLLMPFSVRNSSRSMYCNWNRPPSHGNVRSHSNGPRKELLLWLEKLPVPAPLLSAISPLLQPLRRGQRPRESSLISNRSLPK